MATAPNKSEAQTPREDGKVGRETLALFHSLSLTVPISSRPRSEAAMFATSLEILISDDKKS